MRREPHSREQLERFLRLLLVARGATDSRDLAEQAVHGHGRVGDAAHEHAERRLRGPTQSARAATGADATAMHHIVGCRAHLLVERLRWHASAGSAGSAHGPAEEPALRTAELARLELTGALEREAAVATELFVHRPEELSRPRARRAQQRPQLAQNAGRRHFRDPGVYPRTVRGHRMRNPAQSERQGGRGALVHREQMGQDQSTAACVTGRAPTPPPPVAEPEPIRTNFRDGASELSLKRVSAAPAEEYRNEMLWSLSNSDTDIAVVLAIVPRRRRVMKGTRSQEVYYLTKEVQRAAALSPRAPYAAQDPRLDDHPEEFEEPRKLDRRTLAQFTLRVGA